MKLSLIASLIVASQMIASLSSAAPTAMSSSAKAPTASEVQYLGADSSSKTKVLECLCEFTPATGGLASNTEPVLGATREEVNRVCYKMSADRKYAISNCQNEEI